MSEMKVKLITAPTLEPVSVEEALAHLRVDFEDDNALIQDLLIAAREKAEEFTWRAFLTQTWDLYLDAFPGSTPNAQSGIWGGGRIELPMPPLQSVTGVYYTPDGLSEQTLSAGSYHVDTIGEPGGVVLKMGYTWPSDTLQAVNGVRVRFVAGWATVEDVPKRLVQGIKLILGHFYENREGIMVGQGFSTMELPMGIRWVMEGERVFRFK